MAASRAHCGQKGTQGREPLSATQARPKTVQKYLPCLGVFCPGKRDRRQPRSGGAALPPVSEGDAQSRAGLEEKVARTSLLKSKVRKRSDRTRWQQPANNPASRAGNPAAAGPQVLTHAWSGRHGVQDASGGGSKANLARESIDALCRDATLRPARSWPDASTLRSDPPPTLKIRLPNERAARRFLLNKQRLSCTSVVYTDESREHVLKVVFAYHEFHVAEREACFLRKLEPLDIAPRLLCEGQGALLTTYVGEQASFHNLPADYHEQLETMLRGMRELGGVRHNDLYKGLASKTVKAVGVLPMPKELAVELMVQGSKMRMVDFGWASTGGTNRSYACGTRVPEAVDSPFVPNSDKRVVGVLDAMASLRARVGSDGKLRQRAPRKCKKKGGGDGRSAGKSKTLAKAASYQKYSDPTRSLGSQSEVPTLTDGKGGALVVRGYQKSSSSRRMGASPSRTICPSSIF